MAKQAKPAAKDYSSVPDPARSYERAKPDAEAGMGRLDSDKQLPSDRGDRIDHAVGNRQSLRQLNADDVTNTSGGALPDACQVTNPSRPKTRHAAAVQRRKDHSARRPRKG